MNKLEDELGFSFMQHGSGDGGTDTTYWFENSALGSGVGHGKGNGSGKPYGHSNSSFDAKIQESNSDGTLRSVNGKD